MSNKKYDVCIVGSGITGTLVADHFLAQGARVVMLERGNNVYLPDKREQFWRESFRPQADNPAITQNYWPGAEKYHDDLVSIENEYQEFSFNYNMKYGLGGSGAVWSGASWRFTPNDFSTRTQFGYGRDWPFSYEQLAPYYARVEQLFHTAGPQNDPTWPWQNNYPYPAFKQSYLDKVVSQVFAPEFELTPSPFSVKNLPAAQGGCVGARQCVRKCPANARFRPDLHILSQYFDDPNLTLRMGTPCIKIQLDRNKHVANVIALHQGQTETIQAKYYFLASNTIENLRLLLHSADRDNGAVANSSGLLGKYFTSHGALVMSVTLNEPLYVGRGRPTTSSAINTLFHSQRQHFNAYMMEVWNFDWNIGKLPHEVLNKIRRQERHWGETLFHKVREADQRFAATLIFEIEMRPENQLALSRYRDKYNLPLAKVRLRLNERDQRTHNEMQKIAAQLQVKEKVMDLFISGYGANGNHPLGGYVCGEDPTNSVVDPFLRSHDHPNLYILGGGCFNSTSALNPTHTIAATTLQALDDDRIHF